MTLRRNIKEQARQAMQGSYGHARLIIIVLLALALLINLIDAAVMGLLGYEFTFNGMTGFSYSDNFFNNPLSVLASVATTIIRIIILVPLGVGTINWYRQLTDRRRLGVSYIFWVYEGRAWLRAIGVAISVGLRVIPIAALLLVLPIFMLVQSGLVPHLPMLATSLMVGSWVLTVVALLIVVIYSKRYALSMLLLGESYNMTTREAISTSVRYTKGRCTELFLLDLSFIPRLLPLIISSLLLASSISQPHAPYSVLPLLLSWVVLLTLVITLFMVVPYYTMSVVMYCRYLYEYGCSRDRQPQPAEAAQTPPPEPPYKPACEPTSATAGNSSGRVMWRDIED